MTHFELTASPPLLKIVINNTDNEQKKITIKPSKHLNIEINDDEIYDDEMGVSISPAKSMDNSLFSPNRANIQSNIPSSLSNKTNPGGILS